MAFGFWRKKPTKTLSYPNKIAVLPQKRRYVQKKKRKRCGGRKRPRRRRVRKDCCYKQFTTDCYCCRKYSCIRSNQYPAIIVEALKKCEIGISISEILEHFATMYGLTFIRYKVERALDWMKQNKIVLERTCGVWQLRNCPKCECWTPPSLQCKFKPSCSLQQSCKPCNPCNPPPPCLQQCCKTPCNPCNTQPFCYPMIPPPPRICCTPRKVPKRRYRKPCKKKKRRRRSKKCKNPKRVQYSAKGYQYQLTARDWNETCRKKFYTS